MGSTAQRRPRPCGGRGLAGPRIAAVAIALVATVALTLAGAAVGAMRSDAEAPATRAVRLIAQPRPGADVVAEAAVRALGGTVERRLGVLGSFGAAVPQPAAVLLLRVASVARAATETEVFFSGRRDPTGGARPTCPRAPTSRTSAMDH